MREEKYKAWDKENECWHDPCFIEVRGDGVIQYWDDDCSEYRYEDEFELVKFTGLPDKNKIEIYEGDILKHYNDLHLIIWDEHVAGFSWKNCSMDNYLMFRKFVAENCEIVGNRFENHELLEAVK